ncbi:SusC/RagA family TonB-linked outer membrane protein [Mucilaginibacter dorajii]|uniref:TonB-dependent receptor n=1 Tax=Mucilaginibacter dorajii TaxID=692994 RepID=A0ABP7PGD8_9SPHI|nr:TonB-dependent receptor [Mucilaginibacter dorajii]MCS3735451.1 TonB-linked SusC/RagA family outer membrane protein [Mucilaginibacter dorajii]
MQLKLKFCLSIALLLCLVSGAFAQNIRLTGKVTQKSDGQPLPGASVMLKGTTNGAVTDVSGNYSLSIPQSGGTIVVTFLGMKAVEKTVTTAGVVNFVLEDDAANALNEVVVVGYGTQKVTKVSGAISTIKSADIQKLTPTRAEEALQGQVSGVSVIQSGSPGSKPTVLIRGIPSFTGTDPTVIIDGVQQTLTDFNSINPSDIESISVLKDAATTAIYGVKGGNGVIVVTTKTGRKNQKPQISVNANYGVQEVARYIGVLNASEYGAIVNEGSVSSGGNVIFPDLSTLGVGTDWQRQIFHTAPMQTYNLSATGGSDAVSYFLSAGYQSQGGIVGGLDKSRFDRGNFTANLTFQLSKKLKFIVNATDVILNSKGVQENSFNSILGSALNFDPTVPVYNNVPNTVGKYGFSNLILSEVYNPLTKLDNTYNKNVGNKLYGKFELQYNLLNNLTLTSRFGYTKYDSNAKTFTPLVFYGPQNVDNTMNADGSTVTGMHNSVSHEKDSNFNYSWETYGNYNFDIAKDHHFETTLGFSLYRTSGNADGASRQDVPFNSWEFADFTAATGTNSATNTNALTGFYYQYFRRNISYFGRVNYDYKEKYLASFTARRDGSYAFGVDNKFGNFYSGSLGWVVTKEDFFNVPAISFLKIRGSYGVIGNENVNPQYVKIVTGGPDYGPTANSNGYNFDNVFYPGSTVGSAANNALKWERQIQSNVGFDIKFLNNNLSLTADYYQKKVNGLLFTPNASLYLGTVPIPTANIGSTKTNGVDITVGYNAMAGKDFKIGNTITFTTAKNVVTATNTDNSAKIYGGSYFNGQSQTVTVFQKGFTPGYFYGYKTDGLFQSAQEIAASPIQAGAQPGDIKYVDVNKDGKIDANDQTKIGDPFPKFTMGWNLSISYKSFDFSAFTYASIGNDIYRAYERNGNYTNKFRSVLARWTGPGTTNDARYPRYSFTDPNSNIRVSDRYVENGSFVKIKNLQLGFTFPKSITGKVFSSVRVYGQVKNAFVITKYTGYDPEISGGILDTGVDRGEYPQPRIYSFGLDIKL